VPEYHTNQLIVRPAPGYGADRRRNALIGARVNYVYRGTGHDTSGLGDGCSCESPGCQYRIRGGRRPKNRTEEGNTDD
jgi:hypothetical protein